MSINIRAATTDDAVALTTVLIASWRTTYRGIVSDAFLADLDNAFTVIKTKQRLASPDFLTFVAENAVDGDEEQAADHTSGIIGYVTGGRLREPVEDFDGELYAIYLLLSAQRKGIGRALTIRLAEVLRAQGLQSMLLWVLTDNPAVAFYESMGATRVTEMRIAIGNEKFMEAALVWKSLDVFLNNHPKP